MRVYLAARYSRLEELRTYRAWCERAGIEVTSRWLDGDHQILDGQLLGADDAEVIEGDSQHADAVALRKRFAREDWEDLKRADLVVSFTEPPRSNASRGGRHVEFGAALAWGIRCMVVGPRENVFHCLDAVEVFDTWHDASAALTAAVREETRDQYRDVAVAR